MVLIAKSVFSLVWKLLFVLIAFVTVQNWFAEVSLRFFSYAAPPLPVGAIVLLAFLLGSTAMFLRQWTLQQHVKGLRKQEELRREKAEVQAEVASDQVQALQAKIQTLESALEKAMMSGQPGA